MREVTTIQNRYMELMEEDLESHRMTAKKANEYIRN